MRDFSGKGSLWCLRPDARAKLNDALNHRDTSDLIPLLSLSCFKDVSESFKPGIIQPTKLIKNRSTSALQSAPGAMLNPKLTQRLPIQKPQVNAPTDLDAVNALLSMKCRASSMPASGSSHTTKQGRRKQVFKPPAKKPHINPSE